MAKKKSAPKKQPINRAGKTKVPQASVTNVTSLRSYDIPDYRLEHPKFRVYQSGEGSSVEYKIEGDLTAKAPPIRDSKYLSREQCLAIYRWMLLNRRMETALENLYKQSLVVGGVYFGLGPGSGGESDGLQNWTINGVPIPHANVVIYKCTSITIDGRGI